MDDPDVFLWPKPQVKRALKNALFTSSSEQIESQLQGLFSDGYAVLCSSGRSALTLYLVARQMQRDNLVEVFPYASHCVLDAVARVATPQPFGAGKCNMRITYHQWGFVQEHLLGQDVIEDAVDTLCGPNCTLFPGGGAIEIWSLPKILGTLGGGVIWCHTEQEANSLRQLRDGLGGRTSQWILRLLGQSYPAIHLWWQGAECVFPRPSRLQIGELSKAIAGWGNIVADRQEKLKKVWSLAPSWLSLTPNRYPSVVPIELTEEGISFVREAKIEIGTRHMERIESNGARSLVKVLPLPIHQGISLPLLQTMADRIAPFVQSK